MGPSSRTGISEVCLASNSYPAVPSGAGPQVKKMNFLSAAEGGMTKDLSKFLEPNAAVHWAVAIAIEELFEVDVKLYLSEKFSVGAVKIL